MYMNITSNLTSVPLANNWRYPEIVMFSLITVIGTMGNVLIIGAVLVERQLWRRHNVFIVNLAVADLLVSAIHMPSAIMTFVFGETIFPKPGCIFIAFLESVACGVSLMSLMLIAINRYLFICEYPRYYQICTERLIAAAVTSSWVTVGVLIGLPPLVGWGGYGYDAKTEDCIVDRTADFVYNIYGTGIFIMVPLLFTFFCYFKILQTVYRQRKALRNHIGITGRQISKKDVKLVMTLFVVLVVFVLCWGPFVMAILLDGHRDLAPSFVYLSAAWLAMTNSCMNSFIYGLADANFRQGYRKILLCCQTRSNRIHVSSVSINRTGPTA